MHIRDTVGVVRSIRHPLPLVALLILFSVFLLLALLQNPTSLDDGLRHYAYARLLSEEGVFAVPGWSRFFYQGALKDVSTDPWFLSDVLMIPLTVLPVDIALKVFALASVALVLGAFLLLLRTTSLSKSVQAVFILLLFAEPQFLGRLLLARPFALVTALSLLLVWAILRHRHVLAGFLLTIAVLLSHLFLLPLLLGILRLPFLPGRQRMSLFLSLSLGMVAGFLLHPGAGEYLVYFLTVFLPVLFLPVEATELAPGALHLSALILALLAPVILLFVLGQRAGTVRLKGDPDVSTVLSTVFLLFLGYLLRVRMVDLLWPLLLFLLAFLYARSRTQAQEFVRSFHFPRCIVPSLFVLWCVSFLAAPWIFLRDDAEKSLTPYAALSVIPSGSRVLNADWRVFSPAVLLRPDLQYATGLDPGLTNLSDPEVAELLRTLHVAGTSEHLEQTLRSLLAAYPSDYLVMLHKTSPHAISVAHSLPELSLVSASGALAIFTVK